MRYRPHIDGLRTLAVVPVVLFHLGMTALPGGFIGVDVFFVISGFLITGIIMKDLEAGQYSVLKFYQRRIMRIFPALFFMLAFVLVVSLFAYYGSTDLKSVGLQVIFSSIFASNFYFWSEAGYFTAAAETQPLLHTWSLAVEEQFYIIFPILLYFLHKFGKKYLIWTICALSALSIGSAIVLTYIHQPTAFYLLPARAWELGAGALLSILRARSFGSRIDSWLAGVGALLILLPMMLYTSGTPPFPGWAAIFPVVGATLLVGWGSNGPVGLILTSRPIVYIGKVSFSLYLWHWPLIVFYKSMINHTIDGWAMVSIGIVSFVAAVISTELVEKPFRTKRARAVPARRAVSVGALFLATFVALGAVQVKAPISLSGASEDAVRVAEFANYRDSADYRTQFRTGTCLIGQSDSGFEAFDQRVCASPDPTRMNILVVGDSHAAMFWKAISDKYPEANVMQATASGCRFLLDSGGEARCAAVRDWAYNELLDSGEIDAVVLDGRWQMNEMKFVDRTLDYLKSHVSRILLLGPTVEYDGVFPTLLADSIAVDEEFDVAGNRTAGRDEIDQAMSEAAAGANVPYVSVLSTICESNEDCVLYAPDGDPMQFDYGHLTLSGSKFAVQEQAEAIDSALN